MYSRSLFNLLDECFDYVANSFVRIGHNNNATSKKFIRALNAFTIIIVAYSIIITHMCYRWEWQVEIYGDP